MQYQPPPPVFGLYGLYGYAARLLVTHGDVSQLRSPVPGYVWLRESVTQADSRLRMVTQVGYAARFLVTHGYVGARFLCANRRKTEHNFSKKFFFMI